MSDKSIHHQIWAKLMTDCPRRKEKPSRVHFDRICTAFYQAEDSHLSEQATSDVKMYRAEYNIWAYFFGEGVGFPGKDPAIIFHSEPATLPAKTSVGNTETFFDSNDIKDPFAESPLSKNTSPEGINKGSASELRRTLEDKFKSRECSKDYSPQLGWDHSKGEPWMSVRCYSPTGYKALVGTHHRYINTFEKKVPRFTIRYERFEKYVLLWPEFKNIEDLVNPSVWKEFGRLRMFLTKWAAEMGEATPIHRAYNTFLTLPEDQQGSLPLPDGFSFINSQAYCEVLAEEEEGEIKEDDRGGKGDMREERSQGRVEHSRRERVRWNEERRRMDEFEKEIGKEEDRARKGDYYRLEKLDIPLSPIAPRHRVIDTYRPRYA